MAQVKSPAKVDQEGKHSLVQAFKMSKITYDSTNMTFLDGVGLSPKRHFIGSDMMMATTMMLPMYPRSSKLSFADLKCDRSRAAVVVLVTCWLFFK
ncbi:hypothetical protein LWI28_006496 [Acer negundo]|uniref:Uncharacterized protein n=1 Tax=Acer negundo TaxID=4023 RepID=A0AAD5NTV6_ACENE|nr:hypothetical protein LWI28_006496 [Acer negundo]